MIWKQTCIGPHHTFSTKVLLSLPTSPQVLVEPRQGQCRCRHEGMPGSPMPGSPKRWLQLWGIKQPVPSLFVKPEYWFDRWRTLISFAYGLGAISLSGPVHKAKDEALEPSNSTREINPTCTSTGCTRSLTDNQTPLSVDRCSDKDCWHRCWRVKFFHIWLHIKLTL